MTPEAHAETILEAAREHEAARQDLEAKKKTCEYDAGYFLHSEYERVREAQAAFAQALEAFVDARIEAARDRERTGWGGRGGEPENEN